MAMEYTDDKISVLSTARSLAGMYFNPLYQMAYNPAMWDVTNARINIGYSGQSIKRGARIARFFPGGDKLVNKIKDVVGPDNTFLKTSNIWFGMKGDNKVGFSHDAPIKKPIHRGVVSLNRDAAKRAYMQANPSIAQRLRRDYEAILRKYDGPKMYGDQYTKTIKQMAKRGDAGLMQVTTAETDKLILRKTVERNIARSAFARTTDKTAIRMKLARSNIFQRAGSKTVDFLQSHGVRSAAHSIHNFAKRNLVRGAVMAGKITSTVALASLGWEAATMLLEPVGRALGETIDSTIDKLTRKSDVEMGGMLNMSYLSRGAATERQRAIQAISKAKINGRSMLGQEASMLH